MRQEAQKPIAVNLSCVIHNHLAEQLLFLWKVSLVSVFVKLINDCLGQPL